MIDIKVWDDLVNSCVFDKDVGIRIAKLTRDDKFSTFITVIEPKKCVNPHYHKHGDEHYHIISGLGEIKLKDMATSQESSYKVKGNSSFVVKENIMHQLINTGNEPLVLMFSCPASHLDIDRCFL